MAALGAAGRLVREDPGRVVAVRRELVGAGEELPGVVRRDEAERAVGAAVDEDARVHALHAALPVGGRPVGHLHRVAAPVRVEDLLAGPEHLHRAPRQGGQLRHAELEAEGVALAAEGPPERRLDDSDAVGLQVEHVREGPVDVVGDLRRGPEREQAVRVDASHGTVGLDRRVGRAVEGVVALEDDLGSLEGAIDLAELQLDVLGDVVALLALVDRRLVALQGLLGVEVGVQDLVLHVDQAEGAAGGVLVDGRDGGDLVPDEADLVDGERRLVGRPRDHAVARGQVRSGDHRMDPREVLRALRVDRDDARVGVGAAQRLRVQHARQLDVVGVDGRAGRLRVAVDLAVRLADDLELAVGGLRPVHVAGRHQAPSSLAWAARSAASSLSQGAAGGSAPTRSAMAVSTACTICV